MGTQAGKGPGLTIGPESGFGLSGDQIKSLFEAITDEVLLKMQTVPLFILGAEPSKKREGEVVYAQGNPNWNPTNRKGLHYFDGAVWCGLTARNIVETITATWIFSSNLTVFGGGSNDNCIRLQSNNRMYEFCVYGSSAGSLSQEFAFVDLTGGLYLMQRLMPEQYFRFSEPINVGPANSKAFNVIGSRNADSPYNMPSIGTMSDTADRWFYMHCSVGFIPALIYGPSSIYSGLRIGVETGLGSGFNEILRLENISRLNLYPTTFTPVNDGGSIFLHNANFNYHYYLRTTTGSSLDHYLTIGGLTSGQPTMAFTNVDCIYFDFGQPNQSIYYRQFTNQTNKAIRHIFITNGTFWRGFGTDYNGQGVNDFWFYNHQTGQSIFWGSNDNLRIGGTSGALPNARLLVNGNVNDLLNTNGNVNRTASFSLNGMGRHLGISFNTLANPSGSTKIPAIYALYNEYAVGFGSANNDPSVGTFNLHFLTGKIHGSNDFNESYLPLAVLSNISSLLPPGIGCLTFTWNRDSGKGRGDFICQNGGAEGGFDFWTGTSVTQNRICTITNTYALVSGYLAFLTPIAPPLITSNVNNYNPTGLNNTGLLIINSNGAYNITGLQAPTQSWKTIYIMNYSPHQMTLTHNDPNSSAGNRFLNYPASAYTLGSGETVMYIYDSIGNAWRMVK